jgi:3-deoxy-D-manno-octulosonic acid kinase
VTGAGEVPEGFVASTHAGLTFVTDRRHTEALVRAGLDDPAGWDRRLTEAHGGRGATACLELPPAGAARLKRLRRGGLTAALWRDRFAGARRALDNLRVPIEAARRGVATPAPLALLLDRRGPGVRAWLAVEELQATDLRACFTAGRPPSAEELARVLGLVRRMHDRGLEHRDLNLGNLLIRRDGDPQAWVIDLDGARLHPGPLPFGARQRALRRLERSYVKTCHPQPASDAVRQAIYADYAGDDGELAGRLNRGRRAGRVWIGLHRLGWPSA